MERFPSAVDSWLGALLVGVPLVLVGIGILALPVSPTSGIAQIVGGLLTGGLMAAVSVPCHYTLDDRTLTIRCGLYRQRIEIARIESLEKSNSLLSAPALSLKRVKIVYGDGRSQLVSPRDRDGFIAALESRLKK
jgi:hypothetical protein